MRTLYVISQAEGAEKGRGSKKTDRKKGTGGNRKKTPNI